MSWGKIVGRWSLVQGLVTAALLTGCAEDTAPGGFSPATADPMTEISKQGLVVGGCQCPSWQPGVTCGELSYSDIPADDTYYITTFGGPGDGQDMWICGYKSTNNGSWAYMAGHERFGCGKVLVKHPSLDKYCVAEVADCGPNKCVEEAACFCGCGGHVPILDVSPFVTNHLFGITSSGWSEKREVIAWQVDASEAIGCFNGGVGPGTGTLKGVVYVAPDTADRIPGAAVSLNTGQSTTANGVGYWEFELDPGTYTATASKVGYLTASQTRTVGAGATVWGSIGLNPCVCDDGNPCTNDTCSGGGCVHANNAQACNDSDACTTGDHCTGGQCVGSGSLACDDGNPCTDDGCAPQSGCPSAVNADPCDDGDPCTVGDTCAGGGCVGGAPLVCDDGNPCTDGACDGPAGCVFSSNQAACDDGDACTGGDVCADGVCAGLDISAACGDGNPCTDDTCDPASGCLSVPNALPCDDGDACTVGDTCGAGSCLGAVGLLCDDGNPCTDDGCSGIAGCVHIPNGDPCDDGDPCTDVDGCWEGQCTGLVTDPGACDDGNTCTADTCQAGVGCVHVQDLGACDDGNLCTDDACSPGFGCAHTARTGFCDDGDACTWNDHCAAGVCQGGEKKTCVDGNPCTADLCLPTTGACAFPPNTEPCDDGDPCTDGDVCADGICVGEALPECGGPSPVVDPGSEVLSEPDLEPEIDPDPEIDPNPDPNPDSDPSILQGPTAGGCDTTPGGTPTPLGVLLTVAALVIIRTRESRWT